MTPCLWRSSIYLQDEFRSDERQVNKLAILKSKVSSVLKQMFLSEPKGASGKVLLGLGCIFIFLASLGLLVGEIDITLIALAIAGLGALAMAVGEFIYLNHRTFAVALRIVGAVGVVVYPVLGVLKLTGLIET